MQTLGDGHRDEPNRYFSPVTGARFRRWAAGVALLSVTGCGTANESGEAAAEGDTAPVPTDTSAVDTGTANGSGAAAQGEANSAASSAAPVGNQGNPTGAAQGPTSSTDSSGGGGANSEETASASEGQEPNDAADGAQADPAEGSSDEPGSSAPPGGARFVIPQLANESIGLTFREFSVGDTDLADVAVEVLDHPGLPREYRLVLGVGQLNTGGECPYVFEEGHFEIESVTVAEDLDGTGNHLSVEADGDGYLVRHDGPGTHNITVTGTFVVEAREEIEGLDPEEYPYNEPCEIAPDGSRHPFSYTRGVVIREAGGMRAESRCGESPLALSGRDFHMVVELLDDNGHVFNPANVANRQPLDVFVDTEDPSSALELESVDWNYNLVLSGETQNVHLSTEFGPLLSYQLIQPGDINGWEVDLTYADTRIKGFPPVRVVNGATYEAIFPDGLDPRAHHANTQVLVDDVTVCSPITPADFTVNVTGPDCDGIDTDDPASIGAPGFVATALLATGACSFELAFPEANAGAGLSMSVTTTFVDGEDDVYDLGSHRDPTQWGCA